MRQIDTLEDIDALFSAGGTTSSVRQIDTIDDIDSLFGGPSRSTNYGPSAISGPFNPSYAPPEEPEYLRPVEPAYSYVSPATALQRQVDATAAARKMSQDYATLPKPIADLINAYKDETLAREARDFGDQLISEYPEYSEEIEKMLLNGIRLDQIRDSITKKRERKRRQSELATQYPDFAKDVGRLFDQGFSADEVETQVGAMARSAYEQRQAKEALQYGKIAERGISLPPAQPVKEEGPSIGQQAAGLGAEVAIGATSQAAGAALAPATWGISYPVLSFAGGFTGSLAAQEIEGRDTISYGRAIRDGLLNLIPAGKGVKAATVGGKIAKTAVRGAVAGAPIGAVGAVIETGIEEQRLPTFEEIASQAAGGAVSGAVIGGAFAGFGEAFKSAYSKFAGKTTKQLDDAYRAGDPDAKLVVDTMKKVSRDAPDDVAPTSVINRAEDIEKKTSITERPAGVPEQTPEQRQYVLDQVLMEEAGRANIADYERMMETSRQETARRAEEAKRFQETVKAREAGKQADELLRRLEEARAKKPETEVTGEGPVTGVMPEDKYIGKQITAGMIGEREIGALYGRRDQLMKQLEKAKPGIDYDVIQSRLDELNRIIDENKPGATTNYSSADDLRSKLEEKIKGIENYTERRLALEDDARLHGVQFAGRTPDQIISDITRSVERERAIAAGEQIPVPRTEEKPAAPVEKPQQQRAASDIYRRSEPIQEPIVEAKPQEARSAFEIAMARGEEPLARKEDVSEVRPEQVAEPVAKPFNYGDTLEQLDINALREDIKILGYKGGRDRLVAVAEKFGLPTGGTPREILLRIKWAYNDAKKRQLAEGSVGEYRGDGARVQEEGQDRIITPFIEKGRPEAGGGYRPAPGGNVPPGPVGRGVQGQQAVTPAAGGAVPPTTPPPAAGGAAGAAGAPAPLPGGQKRFGFIGPTKQKKSVDVDESISPNVKAVDDALERQQRDLERLSMDKGRKSFNSIAEGLWDSQSLAKRKLIASELKDAESRLILRKGWAANAKDQYDERISAIDKLITHGNEKSFSEYLEMRRLVEVADLKSAKGEDYDLPYGITPEQAKEWISTFERQKSADGTLNTYKAAADEYYKAARQQLDEMRDEGLLTKEGHASLVQNHKNYSPQQMIDKLDPDNSSGLAKPGAGAPIKALKGGSESGRVIDYRYLLARTIAAAQNRIFTNRANKELVSGVQKGGEKVAKEIGAIIDDGSFDKIPAGYERIKSFDDGIEKSIFVPKEFAKSWNESDPGLNKATAEFLRTWSGSRVVKAMATGYNPEFIFSNFPRDAAYAWFRTGEYSPILPIGAVQQVKDYVDTAKDAFRKSGIYKDYLKEGGGLDGLSAEGRLDKNPWDKVTPTTQTAKDLARWASFLGEFSERWTRLAVYNRAIKNGKSKMEAAKIARDMLDFSQGGKLVKGVDTVVPYLNAMTQGTRGLANSFTENGLGKQSFKAAQVMAIAAGLGSVAREYFNEQWNAISDQEKASKWIIPLPGSYKDDEGKTRYRYLAIPKDQGQAVFAAMSDAMVGAMRGEKPDAKALLFALKQAVPDVTAGSPIGNAALAYFNNLDTFRMEEVYKGRPTTPSAEFSGNAALDESMRKLSEISGGAIEISPARLKRATEKIILPHNPFTIMTGLAANQLLPEELRAEANEFAIENQPFIRRFLRSTQPIEVPASVAEKAERLGLETGDKPGKQVRREVYQAERELGAKRNVQDKEIRKIMSGIKSGRTSYRDLLRYIDETPEEDRNRIRRRMNDIQEEYGLEFDFSGSDIGLPKLSELRGGLKTIK